jgi:hypothetical protein
MKAALILILFAAAPATVSAQAISEPSSPAFGSTLRAAKQEIGTAPSKSIFRLGKDVSWKFSKAFKDRSDVTPSHPARYAVSAVSLALRF